MTWIRNFTNRNGVLAKSRGIDEQLHLTWITQNKPNLRDLIAATGLVILVKIGFKLSIFCPCNLEIDLRDLIAATGLVILVKIGFKSSIFLPM